MRGYTLRAPLHALRTALQKIPATTRTTPSPAPHLAVNDSPLFRLPPELRVQIYEHLFADSTLCPLYIEGENIRSSHRTPSGHHTALLRTCRAIAREASDTLYSHHPLHLLLLRPSLTEDHRPYPIVCTLADLTQHLQRIHHLGITVEYGRSLFQQSTATLLLRWVWYVLHARTSPLESLTLRMTDDDRELCHLDCRAQMETIGRRFHMLDQPPEIVFEAWESECWCVKGWTQLADPIRRRIGTGEATEADLRAAVVQWTERVPRAWWQVRKWFLYL